MKPDQLKQLIDGKTQWTAPLTSEEKSKGFKGWYSSKYLPHFDSPGAQQFITYRLADSLPSERQGEWRAFMATEDKLEKQRKLERYLDLGHGCCHLRDPRIARVVQENLWHADGVSYRLLAWVLMPNHVHALIEFWQVPMRKILQSWKGHTSKEANKTLRRQGQFWEDDYFDRYIRDAAHLWRVVRYIENNPVKARLVRAAAEWPWSGARFRSKADTKVLTHAGAERFPGKDEAA
jgi:REP element-mobilizing transposase RayT